MHPLRCILLSLLLILPLLSASAQADAPAYAIQSVNRALTPDNTGLRVQVDVVNTGGAAASGTTLAVISVSTGTEIASQPVRPLAANDRETIAIIIPTADLQPGPQSLRIVLVGNGTALAEARTSITIPSAQPDPDEAPDAQPETDERPLFVRISDITIDLNNPQHVVALAGLCLAGVLLALLVVFVLMRLIFGRKPQFTPWQPPYVQSPLLNPNSQAARRQGWQLHAQNDLPPPAYNAEGSTHIRKLLTGISGTNLENWQITALRISQYDQYGRVARSQLIAPRGIVRRLNRAAKGSEGQPVEQTIRNVRPVARALVNRFRRRLNARTATLPIALDVRLRGTHGEVQILFELFTVRGGQWQLLDRWEPDINLTGKTIDESFTYSLYGMRPDETFKVFPQRLQNDLTRVLVGMLNKYPGTASGRKSPPPPAAQPAADTPGSTPHVE
jgi:hypothetical protein